MNLGLLVFVFLLTDLLRYKPVIVTGGLSAVVCWSMIRWGTSLVHMQVSHKLLPAKFGTWIDSNANFEVERIPKKYLMGRNT